MKQVKQFRYYGPGDVRNYPPAGTEGMISGSALGSSTYFLPYMPIIKLGIQTLPGTEFYLNNLSGEYPIIIGHTGIYELDLTGISEINSFYFNQASIQRIEQIQDAYLIIDIIYDKGE